MTESTINVKPSPPKKSQDSNKTSSPWSQALLPNQGPKINGSSLSYTCSSNKSIKMPEARA